MTINDIIKQMTGRKPVQNTKIKEWLSWYMGKVSNFHSYKIYNGQKEVKMERLSLGMPKKVCEDWANMLMNEKVKITLPDPKTQDVFDNLFKDTEFWHKANEGVEKYFALGIGAFVEGVNNLWIDEETGVIAQYGKATIQFVNGTKVFPISIVGERITECVFVNVVDKGIFLSAHLLSPFGTYEIHNTFCAGTSGNYILDKERVEIFITGTEIPFFQILKPNIANNVDISSPLGLSIYANSLDVVKSIDMVYDSLYNEFNLGRKRIFISTKLTRVDPRDGNQVPVFDTNDVAFYGLPETEDGKGYIKNDTQELRVDSYDRGLQRQLDLFGSKCGFGTNHYRFDSTGLATATQVISENSDLFRNLKKHEIILEQALLGMIEALMYIINTFTNESVSNKIEDVKISFDDSIIEDKSSEQINDRQDVAMGVMSKAEYREKYYNEDLETAKKVIKEIEEDSPTITDYMSSAYNNEGE